MNAPKHGVVGGWTPGPWCALGDNGKYLGTHGWSVDHESESFYQTVPVHRGGYVVAMVVDADEDSDQLEANARLIACAPELVDALEELLALPDVRVIERESNVLGYVRAKSAFEKARTIFNKARGG